MPSSQVPGPEGRPPKTTAPGTAPRLTPATVVSHPAGQSQALPYSPLYDDVYHAAAGAWAQARHVFLQGNGLPERWSGRERFVILETGFGLGNNFLATWATWRADPHRCDRLIFISIEKHPLRRDDLRQVHAQRPADQDSAEAAHLARRLCQAWPPLTPGMHLLDFDETDLARPGVPAGTCGVTLLLALGDIADMLPSTVASVDAFYLDGFAPAKNPEMWDERLLGRLNRWAAPGATAATWSAARGVRDALTAAGFAVTRAPGFAGKRDMTRARHEPRFTPPPQPGGLWPASTGDRHALVIGAGLAGSAAAWALTREGWRVTLMDQHTEPAQEASGNPGGLFHSIVHRDDGLHARAHRAAALMTAALGGAWVSSGRVAGFCEGLLRLDARTSTDEAAALLARLGLPEDHLVWLDQPAAAALASMPVPSGGWLFKQGGWLHPGGYARALVDQARATGLLQWLGGTPAATLTRASATGLWQAQGPEGTVLAEAPHVVLANASAAAGLVASLSAWGADVALPLTPVRGQVSWLAPAPGLSLRPPQLPVAGKGYALTLADGALLCGATTQHHDDDRAVRDADHRHNLAQARALGAVPEGWPHESLPRGLMGRVGWRATTPDRLPLIGALPLAPRASERWPDQPRRVPRLRDESSGVFLMTGLGSRGITWAALGARLLAHWITGGPCPIEADLRDALDPARFAARHQRLRSARGQ